MLNRIVKADSILNHYIKTINIYSQSQFDIYKKLFYKKNWSYLSQYYTEEKFSNLKNNIIDDNIKEYRPKYQQSIEAEIRYSPIPFNIPYEIGIIISLMVRRPFLVKGIGNNKLLYSYRLCMEKEMFWACKSNIECEIALDYLFQNYDIIEISSFLIFSLDEFKGLFFSTDQEEILYDLFYRKDEFLDVIMLMKPIFLELPILQRYIFEVISKFLKFECEEICENVEINSQEWMKNACINIYFCFFRRRYPFSWYKHYIDFVSDLFMFLVDNSERLLESDSEIDVYVQKRY